MRKVALLVAIIACLAATPTKAAPGGCTNDSTLAPMGDEVITVSSTALPFTATAYAPAGQNPAVLAVCTVETDSIRYRVSGLNPTASVGTIAIATATAPASFTVCGTMNIQRFRMIRVTTDASVTCQYYRRGDQ
jgi:hypothetical protein